MISHHEVVGVLNDLGAVGASPRTAPTNLHYFLVDDGFEDAFELQAGWTAGVAGDNATAGLWERADPAGTTYNGSVVQPDSKARVAAARQRLKTRPEGKIRPAIRPGSSDE